MKLPGDQRDGGKPPGLSWSWFVVAGCLGVLVGSILAPRQTWWGAPVDFRLARAAGPVQRRVIENGLRQHAADTPEQIVAARVQSFAHDRLRIAHAMAKRFSVPLPYTVEAFFKAVAEGRWEDLNNEFTRLKEYRDADASGGLRHVWGPILETLLIAECAHSWPAQKLLDYGQETIGALPPGMVYVGGTDPGRGIPTLLNETSGGDRHVLLTQNGLADGTYVEYLRFLYGDQMALPTEQETSKAFSDYISDAQKRLEHDRLLPNEPKQVQPGEDVHFVDESTDANGLPGTSRAVQVSGNVAVMAINERILQTIMDKNPGMSFALEESFPLRSTYATATPLGPIMQLRATDGANSFSGETAAQALDYWRTTSERLSTDPEAPAGSDVRKTYSHMAWSQANLLADHNYLGEAEQTYRVAMQIEPNNPEPVYALAHLLAQAGRSDEANQLLKTLASNSTALPAPPPPTILVK